MIFVNGDISILFGGTGVHELDGKAELIQIAGESIWLGGVAVDHESRMNTLFPQLPSKYFTIILYHFPSQFIISPGIKSIFF